MKSIEPYEQSRTERIRQTSGGSLGNDSQCGIRQKTAWSKEMIYYIEKLDINEEKQRLANHLEIFHGDHGKRSWTRQRS